MNNIKFGTDGWRAIIAQEFTFQNVKIVAQAYSDYLNRNNMIRQGVAIAYDTRFMSAEFALVMAQVIASNFIPVFLSNTFIPTPILSFAIKNRGLDGGIMITASHNPYTYNGIKFKGPYGGPVTEPVTGAVEQLMGQQRPKSDALCHKEFIKDVDLFPEYREQIRKFINYDVLNTLEGKVVFDSMHAAGSGYFSKLLSGNKFTLIEINTDTDPTFGGIAPEPIAQNLKKLSNTVINEQALVGLATDGDADRFGVLDNTGRFADLHDLMPLLFEHLVQTRDWPGHAVRTASMADTIDKLAAKYARQTVEVPVGFKQVSEKMRQGEVLLGAEESGGFGYLNHIPERDGILSCLLLLEMLAEQKKTLTQMIQQLRDTYGDFAYGRIDKYAQPDILIKNLDNLKNHPPEYIGGFKIKRISLIDGLKFYFQNNSWMLLRASQTEPMGRIYVGSTTPELVDKILKAGEVLFTQE